MTEQDLFRLSNSNTYKFILYHGEEKNGILVEKFENNRKAYYVIKVSDIKSYNENPDLFTNISNKVTIESIKTFEPHNRGYVGTYIQHNEKIYTSNATKLIILGAGASFDFSFDEKLKAVNRPPLTNNLFNDEYDDILKLYPGANIFASEILQAGNVELFFQEQWEIIRNHYDPDLLNKIINTQYYLQHLFNEISNTCSNNKRNNYTTLISLISKYHVRSGKQVLITSFNYDTLLEQSIEAGLGYSYKSINDYIDGTKKLLLFKPHGSCNWVRNFNDYMSSFSDKTNKFFSENLYRQTTSYADIFKQLEEEIKIVKNPSLANNDGQNPRFLPQLLIPFTDKDEFIMPKNHRTHLEKNLENIDEILIIGWKGTENVFKELLNSKIGDKKITVTVANKNDKSIEELFHKNKSNIQWNYQDTFTELMKNCITTKDNFFS